MGIFNEGVSPQGYKLGGEPENVNPFFEGGPGGGGLTPDNINITGQAEYDSTATEPAMTVNKTTTEDSASFNIDLKIPEAKAAKTGAVEVTNFRFSKLPDLLRLIVERLYPTSEAAKNANDITFSISGRKTAETFTQPFTDSEKKAIINELGFAEANAHCTGIRVIESTNLRYYETVDNFRNVNDFSYTKMGIARKGPLQGTISAKRAFNTDGDEEYVTDIHFDINFFVTASASDSSEYDFTDNMETSEFWFSCYYDYTTDSFYGLDSYATEQGDFGEVYSNCDGGVKYGSYNLIGAKGFHMYLGHLDNDTTGFNNMCNVFDGFGLFDFIAMGTKEQIDFLEVTP